MITNPQTLLLAEVLQKIQLLNAAGQAVVKATLEANEKTGPDYFQSIQEEVLSHS